MADAELRFGIVVHQDAPLPMLVERFRRAEALGFDAAYVCDHSRDYRHPGGYWLDGWTVLAALAGETSKIRLGTLVSNPILRSPVLLAAQAVAVDHLSGGRLELGIGTGIAGFDHDAMGVPYWSPAERAARFAEYVQVVDGLLRDRAGAFVFEGRYHATKGVAMNPTPLQQPRPPITLGGQSPTVLRLAATHADCWNTHGPFDHDADSIFEVTRRQNRHLDELCRAASRDPRELRRSLLLHAALDAWASPDAFEANVTRFVDAGMREFVAFWPADDATALLEKTAVDVLPNLRSAATPDGTAT